MMIKKIRFNQKTFAVFQACFWMCVFLFHLLYFQLFNTMPKALVLAILQTGFFLLVVYIHLGVLFPIAYKRKNIVLYIPLVIAFLVVITYVKFNLMWWIIRDGSTPNSPRFTGYIYQGFIYFITISVSALIRFTVDYLKLRDKEQKMEKERLVSELHFLKHQVQPHFLFNTLNSLLYLSEEKSDLAPVVVKKLAELMRYLLEKNKAEKTSFQEELSFIQAYMDLEKLRIPSVEIELAVRGETKDRFIPSLLLLPLVENAFKHGIDKSRDNYVSLSVMLAEKEGEIVVHNFNHAQRKTDGNGLNNLRKRLNLIYGTNYLLTICSNTETYTANLKIPYV